MVLHLANKKPFDIIAEGVISANWQPLVDGFVTWFRTNELTIFERELMISRLRKALKHCPEMLW